MFFSSFKIIQNDIKPGRAQHDKYWGGPNNVVKITKSPFSENCAYFFQNIGGRAIQDTLLRNPCLHRFWIINYKNFL